MNKIKTKQPMESNLTIDIEETIIANGLKTRVWTLHPTYGYGCSECCNGDRCDEDCTAVYKGRRKDCPHCKGRGWIPENEVKINSNTQNK